VVVNSFFLLSHCCSIDPVVGKLSTIGCFCYLNPELLLMDHYLLSLHKNLYKGPVLVDPNINADLYGY
jgi:hypothetical protein